MRCASIDIGTNTVRVLVADVLEGNILKLHREQIITRLGENLRKNKGYLSNYAVGRTIAGIQQLVSVCKKYGVERIGAVATSAARSSLNGNEFIKNVELVTGVPTIIVSGREEALLTIRGILGSLTVNSRNILIMDIGGGSTEYSLIVDGKPEFISSIDIGVLHLSHEYNFKDIIIKSDMQLINDAISETLEHNLKHIVNYCDPSETLFVATSGTPLTLACICRGLKSFDTSKIDGTSVSKEEIHSLLEEMAGYGSSERLQKFSAIAKGRESIIIPGSMILLNSMSFFDLENMVVTESSLLEGVLLTDKYLRDKEISL